MTRFILAQLLLLLLLDRGGPVLATYNVSYSFHVPSEWGTLSLKNAGCCPWSSYPKNKTVSWRGLPTAIGLGVQKGGSTSLSAYLSRHERYVLSRPKETHFFDKGGQHKSVADYQKAWRNRGNSHSIRFDFTPSYLWIPFAACRIKKVFPDMKFLVILRDPATRAYSEFTMVRTRCKKPGKMCSWVRGDFLDYAKKGIADLKARQCTFTDGGVNGTPKSWNDCFRCMLFDNRMRPVCRNRPYYFDLGGKRTCFFFGAQFVSRGLYAAQLAWWFELFDPQNFLILNSGKFFKDPLRELEKVNAFFGVEEKFKGWMTKSRGMKSNYAKFEDPDKNETLALLREFYARPNQELYRLLEEVGHSDFAPFEGPSEALALPEATAETASESESEQGEMDLGLEASSPQTGALIDDTTVEAVLEAALSPSTKETSNGSETDTAAEPPAEAYPVQEPETRTGPPQVEHTEAATSQAGEVRQKSYGEAVIDSQNVEVVHREATKKTTMVLTHVRKMPKIRPTSEARVVSMPMMMLILTVFIIVAILWHRRFR